MQRVFLESGLMDEGSPGMRRLGAADLISLAALSALALAMGRYGKRYDLKRLCEAISKVDNTAPLKRLFGGSFR